MGAFSHLQENFANNFDLNISIPPLNSSIFFEESINSNNFSNKFNKKPFFQKTEDLKEM